MSASTPAQRLADSMDILLPHNNSIYNPFFLHVTQCPSASLILSAIVNKLDSDKKVNLSRKDIQYFTGLSDRQYRTAMKNILNLDIIQCHYDENAKTNLFKINKNIWKEKWEAFESHFYDVLTKHRPNRHGAKKCESKKVNVSNAKNAAPCRLSRCQHIDNINNINNTPDIDLTDTVLKKDNKYLKYAKHLAHAIKTRRKLNCNSKVPRWVNDFRLLVETDEVELKRMEKVLRWYCNKLKKGLGKWDPVCYKAGTFRKKFINIEDAMIKSEDTKIESEEIILSKKEERMKMEMTCELKNINTIKMNTMPKLIQKLNEYHKKANELLIAHVKHEKVLQLYQQSLFSTSVTFVGYAMWIRTELERWDGWKGDLNSFAPSGDNFERYLKWIMQRSQLTLDSTLKKVIDEARKS